MGTLMQQNARISEIEKIDERRHNLEKEAFQLANYYFVFQGVIFTAIYKGSSPLTCHYRWLPFCLSLFAGVLNLSAFVVMVWKCTKLLHKKDTHLVTEGQTKVDKKLNWQSIKVLVYERKLRFFNIAALMVFFVVFFTLMLAGSLMIPCSKIGYDTMLHDNNCVKNCDALKCLITCPTDSFFSKR